MELTQRIRSHFEASIETQRRTLQTALPALERAARALADALKAGHKVLACGNGGSAADAQHFAAELTGRFERERPGLPGLALTTDTSALTAIANDYSYEQVFAKQVRALARPGDWLLAISGRDGGRMATLLKPGDVELRAASAVTARVQETHILLLHCLCDALDELLFPAA